MTHFCLGLHANDELNVAGENGKVLVNINHPNKDCDIFLPEAITGTLKPHQVCPLILLASIGAKWKTAKFQLLVKFSSD